MDDDLSLCQILIFLSLVVGIQVPEYFFKVKQAVFNLRLMANLYRSP
jgi:predicted nuclease of restriction endonuclease-like RecB superfamily